MDQDEDLDEYAGGEIKERKDTKYPKFLFVTYAVLLTLGAYWFYSYHDGSHGMLDRGYWHELAKAAKTTWKKA